MAYRDEFDSLRHNEDIHSPNADYDAEADQIVQEHERYDKFLNILSFTSNNQITYDNKAFLEQYANTYLGTLSVDSLTSGQIQNMLVLQCIQELPNFKKLQPALVCKKIELDLTQGKPLTKAHLQDLIKLLIDSENKLGFNMAPSELRKALHHLSRNIANNPAATALALSVIIQHRAHFEENNPLKKEIVTALESFVPSNENTLATLPFTERMDDLIDKYYAYHQIMQPVGKRINESPEAIKAWITQHYDQAPYDGGKINANTAQVDNYLQQKQHQHVRIN